MAGVKHDGDKVRYELLPPELLHGVAEILTFGAKKYADRNWESGISYSRVFGALMRHLWAWWAKAGPDSETGKSHLWHAGCCLAFLITYEARNMSGYDDRPTHGDEARNNVLPVSTPPPAPGPVPDEAAQSVRGGPGRPLDFWDLRGPVGGVEVVNAPKPWVHPDWCYPFTQTDGVVSKKD